MLGILFLKWTILYPGFNKEESDLGGFPGGTVVKNPPANTGDIRDSGSIPR